MAIDKNKIIEMAKKRGLDIGEETVQQLGELALDIVDVIVTDTDTPVDDMVWAPIEGAARNKLRDLIDKIDGEDDVQ